MSISSEITRITNAKTAIASAISSKGVTVPSGAKIDDMPALIDDISGGGNYQSKSVTYTSNGTATVTPDAGYDALSEVNVTVDVSGGGGVTALENFLSMYGQFYGYESGGNLFGSLNLIECDLRYVQFYGCAFTNIIIDSCTFHGCFFTNVSFANTIFIDTEIGYNEFGEGVTFLGATINGKTGTQADEELIGMIGRDGGCVYSPITLPSGATYSTEV